MDLAIAVDGWPQFEAIKARLVATGAFEADEQVIHKLYHLPVKGRRGYPIDLIPFGGIEDPAATIAWPPDRSIVLNVAGYREAFGAAPQVEIDPGFVVRVVSLPGLAMLKLFAWADRGADDPRDAGDLALLLRQYAAAGNEDRLYGAELGMLEALGYDLELAGARLLGQDVARTCEPDTRARLLTLLTEGRRREGLARGGWHETSALPRIPSRSQASWSISSRPDWRLLFRAPHEAGRTPLTLPSPRRGEGE